MNIKRLIEPFIYLVPFGDVSCSSWVVGPIPRQIIFTLLMAKIGERKQKRKGSQLSLGLLSTYFTFRVLCFLNLNLIRFQSTNTP